MDRPVGPPAPETPAPVPARAPLHGRYTSVVPITPAHSASLFKHLGGEHNLPRWTYMNTEGPVDIDACDKFTQTCAESKDILFFSVFTGPASDPASEPAGIVSYMSIVPDHLRIEMGNIILSERLGRTRAATEGFFLMMKHAFELGYHRFEWKANNLNKPSLAAAKRLGFVFEGVFRNHMVIKGRVRDTAWFSITSQEWPRVKAGFEAWLSESNFDTDGKQLRTLVECREESGS